MAEEVRNLLGKPLGIIFFILIFVREGQLGEKKLKILFLVLGIIMLPTFSLRRKKINLKRTWNMEIESERLFRMPRNEQHVTCEDLMSAVKFRWKHMGGGTFLDITFLNGILLCRKEARMITVPGGILDFLPRKMLNLQEAQISGLAFSVVYLELEVACISFQS